MKMRQAILRIYFEGPDTLLRPPMIAQRGRGSPSRVPGPTAKADKDVTNASNQGCPFARSWTHNRAFQSQCPLAGDNRSTVAVREKFRK